MAKAPHEISLGMVMAGLEGTAASLDCIAEPTECTLSSTCAQREVWQTVGDTINSVLRSTSIGDLASKQQRMASRGMYYI